MFDEYGNFHGEIPEECVRECTAPGVDASCAVRSWVKKLNFQVPRDLAITYLRHTGGWDIEDLQEMEDQELAEKVLWFACGDLLDNGEWFGLVE